MPATTDEAKLLVSVVVPACGRMDLLDRSLDALVRQHLEPQQFEIIVVDDEPNHNTLHLVAGWRTRTLERGPRLSYVANPGPSGPASARNRGWRAARAPIVAFTSDDAVPEPGWLAAGLAAFRDDTDVVCGPILTPVPARPTEHQRSARGHEAADFTSANCFFRKPVLERLDGFDERFSVPRGTDADMHFRLLEHGVPIARAPQALVVHPVRPAPWGASLLQIRHAVFDALLYKKHPALYRQKVEPHPRRDHYLIVGVLLLTLAALLAGQPIVAGLGCAAWLLLTARLCAHRLRGAAHTPAHVADMVVTSALLPPLTVFWRLAGAVRYRVRFA
ncbi:glycosyltransferase family 2 protein [Massilia yuzhufengensis]|uniref:Glycosyltransferase, GT2 family n=1 Tax=Massilia yuzhufengensis TaxID=1164594 RepID=A0A1I1NP57_9BURK|nr:glycosyltransferase family A protein [Massilia yuzhufengensis]SFC95530.1 Glycosyltransferase, GT2 family [Massilia yuzhufengensis]